MSLYCPVCKKIQNMPSNFEYESLKADHFVILKALTLKMEIICASRIFLRSEKNRNLQYMEYFGDGD